MHICTLVCMCLFHCIHLYHFDIEIHNFMNGKWRIMEQAQFVIGAVIMMIMIIIVIIRHRKKPKQMLCSPYLN